MYRGTVDSIDFQLDMIFITGHDGVLYPANFDIDIHWDFDAGDRVEYTLERIGEWPKATNLKLVRKKHHLRLV